jgi:uncharacterized membrane protein
VNATETEFGAFAAILGMAAVAHLIRLGGFWMMARVPLTPRLRRMLDALPGSVVAATILPLVVRAGPAAAVAMALVVALMAWRRNEFLAVFAGIGLLAALRAAGFS